MFPPPLWFSECYLLCHFGLVGRPKRNGTSAKVRGYQHHEDQCHNIIKCCQLALQLGQIEQHCQPNILLPAVRTSSHTASTSCFCLPKAITKEETEAIAKSSVQLLSSALRDLESQTSSGTGPGYGHGAQYEIEVASFLWSESQGDLLSDAGWVSVTQRGQQQQRSGLAMKTQALTPCIQNFCSSMDAKLKARLDDLQHYLPCQFKGRYLHWALFLL